MTGLLPVCRETSEGFLCFVHMKYPYILSVFRWPNFVHGVINIVCCEYCYDTAHFNNWFVVCVQFFFFSRLDVRLITDMIWWGTWEHGAHQECRNRHSARTPQLGMYLTPQPLGLNCFSATMSSNSPALNLVKPASLRYGSSGGQGAWTLRGALVTCSLFCSFMQMDRMTWPVWTLATVPCGFPKAPHIPVWSLSWGSFEIRKLGLPENCLQGLLGQPIQAINCIHYKKACLQA